eukprot:3308440-Rhodomonas_salina.1
MPGCAMSRPDSACAGGELRWNQRAMGSPTLAEPHCFYLRLIIADAASATIRWLSVCPSARFNTQVCDGYLRSRNVSPDTDTAMYAFRDRGKYGLGEGM